jgi:hypothetical protein
MNRTLLPLAFLPSLLTPIAAQAKIDLKVAHQKGEVCALVSKQKQQQTIDLGAQQIEIALDVTHDMLFKITDVGADGVLSVEVQIKRIRGTFDGGPMMGGAIDFDTAPAADGDKGKKDKDDDDDGGGMGMPSAARVSAALVELCGGAFMVKFSGGQLTEIAGFEKSLKAARKKAGAGARILGGLLNEGSLRQLANGAFVALPKNTVAVGDGWDADPVDVKGASVETTRKVALKLEKADDDSAEMSLTGTIESFKAAKKDPKSAKKDDDEDDDDAQARQMMADAKIKNGKISGSVTYSRKDGWVLASNGKFSMDIEMPNPMGGDDMKIGVTTTMKVERSKPGAVESKPATAKPATGGK